MKEVFRLHWTEDVIIGTDENIRRSISSIGKNPDEDVHDGYDRLGMVYEARGDNRQAAAT